MLRRLVTGLEQLPEPVVLVLDDFHLVDDPAVLAGGDDPGAVAGAAAARSCCSPAPTRCCRCTGCGSPASSARSGPRTWPSASARRPRWWPTTACGSSPATPSCSCSARRAGRPGCASPRCSSPATAPNHRAADFGGDDHAVVEFLAEEVLARHSPEMQQFLLRTSVAERLNASLAEELSGAANGQQHLEDLAASNTFVVALGVGRTWFRYHALLRQMLRHRLTVESPDLVPELHRRAAHWFSGQGQPLAALRHAADAAGLGPDGSPARHRGAAAGPVGGAGRPRPGPRADPGPAARRHPRARPGRGHPTAAGEPLRGHAPAPRPGRGAARRGRPGGLCRGPHRAAPVLHRRGAHPR